MVGLEGAPVASPAVLAYHIVQQLDNTLRERASVPPQTLRRSSTVDELTEVLRREILAGDLPPGARLREAEFAARYDVSRNTLREALHRLSRSGLVVHRPHRGITVAQPGRKDVGEIFRIRRVLEPAGLRAVRQAEIPELCDLAKSIDRAATRRDWGDLVDRDVAFHAWLVRRLGSSRLDSMIDEALRELRLAFLHIDRGASSPDIPSHVPDHEAIAVLVADSQLDAAIERLLRHLDDAEQMVLNHLARAARPDEGRTP